MSGRRQHPIALAAVRLLYLFSIDAAFGMALILIKFSANFSEDDAKALILLF